MTEYPTAKAERITFLVDAASYFAAFADAVRRARRSVLILAWDIDSNLRLVRDDRAPQPSPNLRELLEECLHRRPQLEVHILCWDYSVIYTFEREPLPRLRMGLASHERLHFVLDATHPTGACHHQKVVVIDDQVAFIGGIDLGRRRWDTPEHWPDDERRICSGGTEYPPYHDIQAVVSGDMAGRLGELCRERWRRATGDALPPAAVDSDPWPTGIEPSARDLTLGLIQTQSKYGNVAAIGDTERFHIEAIAAAKALIYIENQYLTSASIGDALVDRLTGADPPEIVIVTSRDNEGWIESQVMGSLRARLVSRLRTADPGERVRIFYPSVGDGVAPTVHSKLLIVDDRLAYLGSANLSNRSMGLDSECGLAIDGTKREDVRVTLADLRIRLLAEHLGVEPAQLRELADEGSCLIAAIEGIRRKGGTRSLETLVLDAGDQVDFLAPLVRLADPEEPITMRKLVDELFGE